MLEVSTCKEEYGKDPRQSREVSKEYLSDFGQIFLAFLKGFLALVENFLAWKKTCQQ